MYSLWEVSYHLLKAELELHCHQQMVANLHAYTSSSAGLMVAAHDGALVSAVLHRF